MLISGPAEWSEALLATGVKSNLLQNGYNPKLQVSAMSLGPTVAITRYADTDSTAGFARGISDQPTDTLVLHEENSGNETMASRYRLVAWSNGSTEKSLLAIASTVRVEIWEVTITSGISATLRGSADVSHSQGLAWNPCNEVLLVYSKTELLLINASHPAAWRTIYSDSSTRHAWGSCSWSPCGLHVSLAQSHVLHCFSWADMKSLVSEIPRHNQIDASSSIKGGNGFRLEVANASVGPIAAVACVSATVCILTTDTKLVLEDLSRADPAISRMSSGLGGSFSAGSSLLLRPESLPSSEIHEQATTSSNGVIDLTSIRVSASCNQSSLQILSRVERDTRVTPAGEKPRSHLLIVECNAGQWGVTSILDLPHLTSPDLLVVQEMRVIVGSSLSPRLVVVHLNSVGWTASLSGELELPPTHVCRGLHLAHRSPFVDVASTEKRTRATFFHAAASHEPQPVYLSRVKVPRRARPKPSTTPPCSAQESPAIAADKTAKSCVDSGSEDKDLMELILVKMSAMQTQLNARFDDVDKKLQQLTARVEQMEERNSAK